MKNKESKKATIEKDIKTTEKEMNIWLKKIEICNNEILLKTYEKKVISLILTQESLEEKLNNP